MCHLQNREESFLPASCICITLYYQSAKLKWNCWNQPSCDKWQYCMIGTPHTHPFTDWIWLLSDLTCWNAQHEDEHINLFLSISNELCPFYLLAIYMNASSLWTELFLQVKLDHFLIGDPWRWSNQILMHIL